MWKKNFIRGGHGSKVIPHTFVKPAVLSLVYLDVFLGVISIQFDTKKPVRGALYTENYLQFRIYQRKKPFLIEIGLHHLDKVFALSLAHQAPFFCKKAKREVESLILRICSIESLQKSL